MRKIFSVSLICCLMLILLTGCAKNADVPSDEVDNNEKISAEESSVVGQSVVLYAYDGVEDQSYTTVCTIHSEKMSVEDVALAYLDYVGKDIYGQDVQIKEIIVKDDQVWIDFDGASIDNMTLGSGSEGQFFGDLARSLVSNFEEINEIYYSMDNQDFVTGHLWFDKDRPFWYSHEEPND